MRLKKENIIWTLTDKNLIELFLKEGWKELKEEKPKAKTSKKGDK